MRFSVSPGIRSLPIFPLESEEQLRRKYNLQRLIKMASNENCYGPSPKVVEAIQRASLEIHRYPEVYGAPLRSKLAEMLNMDPSQIVLGNGSTGLAGVIARTFLQPNEKCLTTYETFPIYPMSVNIVNAVCETVPLHDNHHDLEGLLNSIRPDTRLIFIANPNNPTGTALQRLDLQRFLERVPANVLVVLDEAYREYAATPVDSVGDIAEHPNLIVLRTFSKVYGLAGLRAGYAVCSPQVADYLSRASFPYAVNLLAQSAAVAALQDQGHVRACVVKNHEQRERMQSEFLARGYSFVPSEANFILMKVPDPISLCQALLREGIQVASVRHFNVPDGIRITLGLPEENQMLLNALEKQRAR